MDAPIRLRGIITTWFFERGFGFITTHNPVGIPLQKYYLHVSNLSGEPKLSVSVEFDVFPVLEGQLPSVRNAVIVERA